MNLMSENINELMSALSKAQGKIQPASKDKANPFFKSKYADLSSVWEACRECLSENRLAVTQTISHNSDGMLLVTTLGHSSGQWIKSEMPIIVSKQDPQTIGSAITYYRRYCLSAIVGVAPEDDDGEKAQSHYRNQKTPEIKKISSLEAENLKMILGECDEKYRKWVFDHIKKQYNTENISDLPIDIYQRMKDAAVKNMEANYERQKVEANKIEPLPSEV
jgi:hypothetical protein